MSYETYCSGYTATPRFPTKADARAWCRSIAKDWRKMKHAPVRLSILDSGEEHWRMETASTLDCVGFRAAR
jgi:hypothetical protein